MNKLELKVYPILLAGGTGTRLWPVSRELYPKQLVKFVGEDSLLQNTIKRLSPVLNTENVRVVCGEQHFHETSRHIEKLGLKPQGKLICEPSGRNTAPAILLAVLHILASDEDAVLCVFPADHVIENRDSFHDRLNAATALASEGHIVTFGIQPHYPAAGYGYIECGKDLDHGARELKRFVEKPDLATAQKYIETGNFFWNSGMFAFKASAILSEFKSHQPELLKKMQSIFKVDKAIARKDYDQLTEISIDYAIMEKTDKGVVLPSDFGWSDIGSWKSLYDFLEKDADNNVIDGDVIAQDTRDCLILGHNRLVATNRLRNMAVVETPDSVFVSDLEHSRDVKSIVTQLKEQKRREHRQHRSVNHPWGISKNLEHKGFYAATEVTVYPDSLLELPAQANTTYHFFILNGRARLITASEDKILRQGEAITCLAETQARIENAAKTELFLIQVELKNKVDE
ncbi:MAG: mannose-1-phosphate guanylyltransferase/mannose-6-phosphate isomerase [Deltaproteobacteria bacterium]|jgi:mannose-1-phosphate guanylyltransferase/mannose-1-phosphate guanylyltransferase/mannose-6-phosphate isomerase|nr:mannose-1-phosphate guanylyltransferase/mannose-6-phosphate isomerase [Deltaproteobacteria bacterium]